MKKLLLLSQTTILIIMLTQGIVYAGNARYVASISGEDALVTMFSDQAIIEIEDQKNIVLSPKNFIFVITTSSQSSSSVNLDIKDPLSFTEFINYSSVLIYKTIYYRLATSSRGGQVLSNVETLFNRDEGSFYGSQK